MKSKGRWQSLARLGQGVRQRLAAHWRWLRPGVRSTPARVALIYAIFIALLLGYGTRYLSQDDTTQGRHTAVPNANVPRPVTTPPAGHKWVLVKTTGYCPCPICCGEHANGRTAINRDVEKYPFGLASERKLFPYRTWLTVPGYGHAMVDDTGGAMRQSAKSQVPHLDLRFRTHQDARNWGVQWKWLAVPETMPVAQQYGVQ